MKPNADDHWLARPTTIRLLWRVFAVVLALTVFAQVFISVKGYFCLLYTSDAADELRSV